MQQISFLLLHLIIFFLSQQSLQAQFFVSEFDDPNNSSNFTTAITEHNGRIIVGGTRTYREGNFLLDKGTLFIYDPIDSAFHFLDIAEDLKTVTAQHHQDSVLFTTGYTQNNNVGILIKQKTNGNIIDSIHLKSPNPEHDIFGIFNLHVTGANIYFELRGANNSLFNTPEWEVNSYLYQLDHDLNIVEITPYTAINDALILTDFAGTDDELFVLFEYQDFNNSQNSGKSIGRILPDKSIDTLYNNKTSPHNPIAYNTSQLVELDNGNLLFNLDGEFLEGFQFEDDILYCIDREGNLLWQHINEGVNRYDVDDRRYNIYTIKQAPSGEILLCGVAKRNKGHDKYRSVAFMSSLNQDGSHNWTRLFYYQPGKIPFTFSPILNDPRPIYTGFGTFHVMDDNTIYAVGNAITEPNFNPDGSFLSNNFNIILAHLDSVGCPYPNCEREVFIGPPSVPNMTVVPGRRWTERSWEAGDTTDRHFRFAPDSIFTAGRYYVNIEEMDVPTQQYLPTGQAMREIMGRVFLREDDFDHLVNNKLLEENNQMSTVGSFPGNQPFLPIQQRVITKDSVTTADGVKRLRMIYNCPQLDEDQTYTWIDGIGRLEGRNSIFRACGDTPTTAVVCVHDDDQLIYQSPVFSDCDFLDNTTEVIDAESLVLFPNPTTGLITLKDTPFNSILRVFDTTGRLLLTTKEASFSLITYPSGNYYVQVLTEGVSVMRKVVKL